MKAQCTICLDNLELTINNNLCTIKCGHVFHQPCLEQWLRRSSLTCPQCRIRTINEDIRRLFFEASPEDSIVEPHSRSEMIRQIEQKKKKIKELKKIVTFGVNKIGVLEAERTTLTQNWIIELEEHNANLGALKAEKRTLNERNIKLEEEKTNVDRLLQHEKQIVEDLQVTIRHLKLKAKKEVEELEVLKASAMQMVEESKIREQQLLAELENMDRQVMAAATQEEESRLEINTLKMRLRSLMEGEPNTNAGRENLASTINISPDMASAGTSSSSGVATSSPNESTNIGRVYRYFEPLRVIYSTGREALASNNNISPVMTSTGTSSSSGVATSSPNESTNVGRVYRYFEPLRVIYSSEDSFESLEEVD